MARCAGVTDLVVREGEHVGAWHPGSQAVQEVGGVSWGDEHLSPLTGQGADTRAGVKHLVTGTRETRVMRVRAASHVPPEQMTNAGKSREGSDVITRKLYFLQRCIFLYHHSHPVVVQIP